MHLLFNQDNDAPASVRSSAFSWAAKVNESDAVRAVENSKDQTAPRSQGQEQNIYRGNVNKCSLDQARGNGPSGSVPQIIPCGENKVTSYNPRESASSFASASPTSTSTWLSNSPASSSASNFIPSDIDDFPLHDRWSGIISDLYGYAPNGERVKLSDPPRKGGVDTNGQNSPPIHATDFSVRSIRDTYDVIKMDPPDKDTKPKPTDQTDPKGKVTAEDLVAEASKLSIHQKDDPVTPAPTPFTKPIDENVKASTTGETTPIDISPLKQQRKGSGAASEVEQKPLDLDAVIVGAGWCGVYLLWKLREKGLRVKLIEVHKDAGGVWNNTNYPGCRNDTEGQVYQFADKQIWKDWNWKERYPAREEVHQYFRHMCLKLDLNRDIIYNTLVTGAKWNHSVLPFNRRWDVYVDEKGTTKLLAQAQFFIPCTGYTTEPYIPPIPGISKIPQAYHTARWPTKLDLTDKRVAILGTGASSIQVIESIGPIVKHLTVLQRTPNLTNPRHQEALSPVSANEHPEMERRFEKMKGTRTGLEVEYIDRNTFDDTPEDRRAVYESLWRRGGQAFWFGNYKDLLVDPEANREAYNFWLSKVRPRIHDPVKRDILAPETAPHAFGCKRPALEEKYYEVFNQNNVDLVDVKKGDEVVEITKEGVFLKSGKFVELDVLILATGYDAAIGSLMKMDIRGKDGVSLRDKWGQSEWYNADNSPTFGEDVKHVYHDVKPPTTTTKKEFRSPFELQPTVAGPSNPQEQDEEQDPYTTGVQTYLGLFTSGFPNLIFPAGPHAPTAFGITPRLAELQGRWVVDLVYHILRTLRKGSIEATEDAEMGWKVGVEEAVEQLLVKETVGWYMGCNIPGRRKEPLFWFGGVPEYMECLEAEEEGGYEGFVIE